MRIFFYALVCSLSIVGCTFSNPEKTQPQTNNNSVKQLNKQQIEFINWWANTEKRKSIYLLTVFRNRYYNETDKKQLKDVLAKNDAAEQATALLETIEEKEEFIADTNILYPAIKWVNNNDVTICREVDREFWPCFSRRYDIPYFYYLSPPEFSTDSNWCLININYISKKKEYSYGGGQLYKKSENGSWENIAFLSYWGMKPGS